MQAPHRNIPLALALFGRFCFPAISASPPVYQLSTVAGSDLVGDGGVAVAAQLAQPEGMVVDSAGNLYVADAANHRVRKVTPDGLIATVAGNGHAGFSGDNGPAAAAQLNQPYGLALDPAGNLYIADYGNQRVRRISADGNITTVAGHGPAGSLADAAPATAALLVGPRNLAVDQSGNLYISEFEGHRVRRVAPDGTIYTVAGIGIAGFGGDGRPAAAAQLAFPAGLALDGAGNLYIVDTVNERIRKVRAGIMSTVCSRESFGMPYIQLSGIAADAAGDLYIPDRGNSYLWQLTPGGTLTRIAADTVLDSPVEAALNSAGDLYIAEARRVLCMAAVTGILQTVAGTGVFGFSGDEGSASGAALNNPTGLAFNNGSLYIADRDNQRVRQIAADGSISTVAGSGTPIYSGDGLPAISAGLNAPTVVAFDPAGNLYITDTGNHRVRRMDPSGIITTFAGNGLIAGFGGEGDPATLTPIEAPQGAAADDAGNVYLSDTNHNRVVRVDLAGNLYTVAGTGTPGELHGPTGLALDSLGNLYIADTQNHRVRLLNAEGALSTAAVAAQLSYPSAIAVDGGGNLFIADTGNHRVLMVMPDGTAATIAGTGEGAYNGDQGPALQMALDHPAGLALDGQGNLWVSDTGNHRVRLLSPGQARQANSASLLPGPLAPGEIFSIFGEGIGPETAVTGAFDAAGTLLTTLGGVEVLFNGVPAPLFYAQSRQINAQVPYELAGQSSAQLQVVYQGVPLASLQVSLADASPALFGVVVNPDGSINSHDNPAPRGSVVVLYATGAGETVPARVTGQAAQAPLPVPVLPVTLTMAGIPAQLLFAGEAPGFVGLMQINAQVPSGFVPSGDLPLQLTVGPFHSPPGVNIAVK